MSEIRRAATVRGLVQGVSFRWYTCREAERLGLTGWVRNERDGTVRLEAQGPEADVAALLAWAGHGPAHARVADVVTEERAVVPGEVGFRVEH